MPHEKKPQGTAYIPDSIVYLYGNTFTELITYSALGKDSRRKGSGGWLPEPLEKC